MKRILQPGRLMAACLLAAGFIGSNAAKAQSNSMVQFHQVTVSSGEREIGFVAMPFTKVLLSWNVPASKAIATCEVECSFDMVNFSSVGATSKAVASDRKQRTFQFEDNSWILSRQPHAQYRIKLVDEAGNVSYSEALVVGLRS